MTGGDVIRYAAWRESYLQMGGRENGPNDHVHRCETIERFVRAGLLEGEAYMSLFKSTHCLHKLTRMTEGHPHRRLLRFIPWLLDMVPGGL